MLVTENGTLMYGKYFGRKETTICEMVFNTSMAGYQEIISDPAYTDKAVVMTYPVIGNYGITDEDFESKPPFKMGALIVREYNDIPSNFRYTKTLSELLDESNICGISEVDTRALTKIIRSEGSQKVIITSSDRSFEDALNEVRNYEIPNEAVKRVSTNKKWYSRTANHKYNVVAVDCGIKYSMIKKLNQSGCNVTVVPYDTSAESIMSLNPDGVFFSDGPGNPTELTGVIETISTLRSKVPMFGIGLGHQLICLAYGAKTYKLKYGCGGGHAVKSVLTEKIEMAAQASFYAVDMDSLSETSLTLTHTDITGKCVEGVACIEDKVFSVQYHPESAPGPQDSEYLFKSFTKLMEAK
ncbi:MAG: glutamine-hydrolyzing carbamoyl-phosphate synthase small subunit [Clostridiales bacterium]|nr:glutamine-hydrolyzing carbamoyl-phosphate synthase small subunit [Clostridiales bacterium]